MCDHGQLQVTVFDKIRRLLRSPIDIAQSARALVEGSANQSRLLNEKSNAIIHGLDNQSRMLNNKFNALIAGLANQSHMLSTKLDTVIAALDNLSQVRRSEFQPAAETAPDLDLIRGASLSPSLSADSMSAFSGAAATAAPLLVAEKTYNTSHPDYDPTVVRNFPGKIFNDGLSCRNPVYLELKKLAKGDEVPYDTWVPALETMLAEAKTVPHADLILQRRDYLEQYVAELDRQYDAQYIPGWVGLEDALFLYWLVRKLKPKTIVQCGVCNGLSSAFIILALGKNGPDGQLHAIDLPPVFNPKDSAWTIAGKVYGTVIPEGKTSGWLVPEAYRRRFEVQIGDAKLLLPKLVERLPSIDMLYHESDHTYSQMMFEFREAKRKLVPGGLNVAGGISWNAALWDFTDHHTIPAYNFKGVVGVAFF